MLGYIIKRLILSMKTITVLGGIVIVALGILYTVPWTQEYVAERIVEVPTVETVDVLEVRIKEAQNGAQASTTAKAQEAYDKVFKTEMKRIEDEVKADYIAEIEKTISDPSY
jgi:LPS O-antigen subunit length determinant protein (WzzB/FepE family)